MTSKTILITLEVEVISIYYCIHHHNSVCCLLFFFLHRVVAQCLSFNEHDGWLNKASWVTFSWILFMLSINCDNWIFIPSTILRFKYRVEIGGLFFNSDACCIYIIDFPFSTSSLYSVLRHVSLVLIPPPHLFLPLYFSI